MMMSVDDENNARARQDERAMCVSVPSFVTDLLHESSLEDERLSVWP